MDAADVRWSAYLGGHRRAVRNPRQDADVGERALIDRDQGVNGSVAVQYPPAAIGGCGICQAQEATVNPTIPLALISLLFAVPTLAFSMEHHSSETTLAAMPAHLDEDEEGHAHDVPHAHGDEAVPAVRWASDEPLRVGMRRLRAATEMLSHGAHGHLDAAQVQGIAAELEAAVQAMFAQCRLAPEPDAALHPLLARVLDASATLAEGRFDAGAHDALLAVLARYPLLFDDEGWSALPAS